MREQSVPVLLGVKKRGAGAHEEFGPERKAGGIERGGDNSERGQRALAGPGWSPHKADSRRRPAAATGRQPPAQDLWPARRSGARRRAPLRQGPPPARPSRTIQCRRCTGRPAPQARSAPARTAGAHAHSGRCATGSRRSGWALRATRRRQLRAQSARRERQHRQENLPARPDCRADAVP